MRHAHRITSAGLTALLATLSLGASAAPAWDYSGDHGPAHWAELDPAWRLCGRGQRQSPIDITAAQRQDGLAPLQFRYAPAPLRVVNDGHTVRVRFDGHQTLQQGTATLTLRQFHFHMPGGDRIRGEEFPLAMHFLHKRGDGRLVALVVLFRQGAEHAGLAALLPHLPMQPGPEATDVRISVDAAALLPAARGYYAYDGSETAPPCNEGVQWLVLKQPQEVSKAQLDQLARMFRPNARPVQPLNGRRIDESR